VKLWGRIWRTIRTGTPVAAPLPDIVDDDAGEEALGDWARELGVDRDVMQRMVEQRRALVFDVADDPRSWGFDLLPIQSPRKDVTAEYRRHTRLTGTLGASFLQDHAPLLRLVPDPPTMPDGTPLDDYLVAQARLDEDSAIAIARHLRTTIQATLGEPLDRAGVEHAVREVSWDQDLDAARVTPMVLHALRDVL
jgi:hypothetical protein